MTTDTPPGKRRRPGFGADQAGFVARLRIIAEHWQSTDRLARATGVSASAFRKWLKGAAEPSRDRLVALAAAAGVSVSWLAQGEGAEPDSPTLAAHAAVTHASDTHGSAKRAADAAGNPAIGRFLLLPKRPHMAAAGAGNPEIGRSGTDEPAGHPGGRSGVPTPGIPTEFIGFRQDWLRATFERDPGDLSLEVAAGDSMEPTIRDRDLLLVDTTDRTFREFGIYVIEARGERLVKRVQRKFDGSLILISDNRIYQPESISADLAKDVHVVGRVIWRGGRI